MNVLTPITARESRLRFTTRTIHAGQSPDPATGAVMVPIYATSTFVQDSQASTRATNTPQPEPDADRVRALRCGPGERQRAACVRLRSCRHLDGAGIVRRRQPCRHVGRSLRRNLSAVRAGARPSIGLKASYVDLSDLDALAAAIRPETRLIWIETPTNPTLKLMDLEAVAQFAKRRGLLTVVDNTFASPWCQRPLTLGVDVVVHSTTKYVNGHSDMIGGAVVVGSNVELSERLRFLHNAVGGIAGPFDSFLALRGLKTLALRMERHCANALELARWLERHPRVRRVEYPGLESHPQHALARRQMNGFGGIVTVEIAAGFETTRRFWNGPGCSSWPRVSAASRA